MKRSLLLRGAAFALLWWVLSEGRGDGWLLGSAAVIAASWASLKLAPPAPPHLRLTALPGFLRFFLWQSLAGGVQVAALACRGRAALRPGFVELSLALPPGAPRLFFAGILGLMPGTLGVALDDARLRLHVLDTRLPALAEARALEAAIGRLFGVAP
ncbi:MAG: Na+/H+ antiporter subunit E [Rhodocyclaceae bacterium]|nr:Na+/H+ antiporter subunit E [Rhodocyclaceae bacterium]